MTSHISDFRSRIKTATFLTQNVSPASILFHRLLLSSLQAIDKSLQDALLYGVAWHVCSSTLNRPESSLSFLLVPLKVILANVNF